MNHRTLSLLTVALGSVACTVPSPGGAGAGGGAKIYGDDLVGEEGCEGLSVCAEGQVCEEGACVAARFTAACQLDVREVSAEYEPMCETGDDYCFHKITGKLLVDPELIEAGYVPEIRVRPPVEPSLEEHWVWHEMEPTYETLNDFLVYRLVWEGRLVQYDDRADVRMRVRRGDESLYAYGTHYTDDYGDGRVDGHAWPCMAPQTYATHIFVGAGDARTQVYGTHELSRDDTFSDLVLWVEAGSPLAIPSATLHYRLSGETEFRERALSPTPTDYPDLFPEYAVAVTDLLPDDCSSGAPEVELYYTISGENTTRVPSYGYGDSHFTLIGPESDCGAAE